MEKKRKKLWVAWILVFPVLLVRGFTTIYPIIMTFINSTYDMSLLKGSDFQFVGFSNYVRIFSDPKLVTSIQFTAIFTIVSMAFHLVLGIILALMLNMKFKGKKFLRTIVLIPWAMPMVVAGLAARWAFNDTYGLINDLIRRFNESFHCDWLVQSGMARGAVIAVDLWKDLPFFAILVLAALQFISGDIYEAAKIDGAGPVRAFFSITLPNIMKTVLSLSIFFTMWRLTSFDVVYAMTSGGPGDSTTLVAYRIMQEAFTNLNLGYASAIAVCLFLVMAVLSTLQLKAIQKFD
ncbi:MAG: sugar ABC transporter permease [Dorea sp.]|nr:sugar ABC transporter permease [Dorea sp.]